MSDDDSIRPWRDKTRFRDALATNPSVNAVANALGCSHHTATEWMDAHGFTPDDHARLYSQTHDHD